MASPILTINHYVFLTRNQRYEINIPETEMEVVGMCSPVWIKDREHQCLEPQEIFCKYKIRHCSEPERQTITFVPGGFLIRLSPEMPKFLLDYEDNGHCNLNLTHKNVIQIDDNVVPVTHFFNVEDMELLNKTLTIVH